MPILLQKEASKNDLKVKGVKLKITKKNTFKLNIFSKSQSIY